VDGCDDGGGKRFVCLQTPLMRLWCELLSNIPVGNTEGIPLPSVKGKGLRGVRHSILLPVYPGGFPNPCSTLYTSSCLCGLLYCSLWLYDLDESM
jgi:hypothetical protein